MIHRDKLGRFAKRPPVPAKPDDWAKVEWQDRTILHQTHDGFTIEVVRHPYDLQMEKYAGVRNCTTSYLKDWLERYRMRSHCTISVRLHGRPLFNLNCGNAYDAAASRACVHPNCGGLGTAGQQGNTRRDITYMAYASVPYNFSNGKPIVIEGVPYYALEAPGTHREGMAVLEAWWNDQPTPEWSKQHTWAARVQAWPKGTLDRLKTLNWEANEVV